MGVGLRHPHLVKAASSLVHKLMLRRHSLAIQRSNYEAWKATGHMHEKYDVRGPGAVGGGGEYRPQVGFGWSNGVLLGFLDAYGELLAD